MPEKRKRKIDWFSKTNLTIALVLTIFVTIGSIGKSFALQDKVNYYKGNIQKIEYKESPTITVNNLYVNNKENIRKEAKASRFVKCINKLLDQNNLSSEISTIIDEINNYYNDGSGYLKFEKPETFHSTRKLVEYSILYSDNIAHTMLANYYGVKNMCDFWRKKGTTVIFNTNNICGRQMLMMVPYI